MDFFSALSLCPPHAHLAAKGELDAFAAGELRHRLDEAVDRGCIHFTLDVSAVTFVDAGGLGTLVRLSNTVAPFGGTVAVVAVSPRFRQVAELVDLAELFGIDLIPDTPPPADARVPPVGRGHHCSEVRRLAVVPRGLAKRRYREPDRSGTTDGGEQTMTIVRHEVNAHRLRIEGSCQSADLSTVQDALGTFARLVDGHLIVDLTAVTGIDQIVADELVAAAHRSRSEGGKVTFVRKHGTLVHDALSVAEQAVRER